MKQCPNPNCIYYTRLEELPDAYVRCPACGGQLVDTSTTTGELRSGHLPSVSRLPMRNLDEEFEEAFPAAELQPRVRTSQEEAYEEGEYYPYESSDPYDEQQIGPAPLSRLGRVGYILGALLLVAACGLFVFVMATRILPQGAATGVQATQTALSSIRPAVNTPITELPTAASLPTNAPPQPPSATPVPAGQAPTTAPLPTATPIPAAPQPTAPVNATAPPPQNDPTGGVLNAFMTTGVVGGEPVDSVSSYGSGATFVLAVQAQFGAGGVTSARVRWYGPDGGLLYEIPRNFSQAGTYYTIFTLSNDAPWVEGNYRADIYTNSASGPAYSVTFSVTP